MRTKISAVIICKNEAHIIAKTIEAAKPVVDEVLVYDTGSTDETVNISRHLGASVVETGWEGYGKSKQAAIALAANDWVLNLDADEVLDDAAQKSIAALLLNDDKTCYRFRFKNFLGRTVLRWGEFGFDSHVRLFNRRFVNWSDAAVHEKLVRAGGVKEEMLDGHILHHTMKDTAEFVRKSVNYALVNAEEYHRRGKKAGLVKQYLSPGFTFFKYYVVRLGFLDGWAGLFAARMAALYAYIKYARLRELWGEEKGEK